MLLNVFAGGMGALIEAKALVGIVRAIFAPAVPFPGIVRENRRSGGSGEHNGDGEGLVASLLAATSVPVAIPGARYLAGDGLRKRLESSISDFRLQTSDSCKQMKAEKNSDSLADLRSMALVAAVIGACASIGFLRHASQHPPPFLAFLFVIWVAAPFALLALANSLSQHWPAAVRRTLYWVTLVITVASVAIYFDDNIAHRTTHPGAVWVAVPPASVLLTVVLLGVAGISTKKKSISDD